MAGAQGQTQVGAIDSDAPQAVALVNTPPPAVALRGISKRFGAVQANDAVDLTVAAGTVQETVEHVRNTLAVMMPGGGYALAPTHMLQDNSPTENVVAMYETARTAGRYR